jgi:uncharacterized protein (TIGR02231 family)
VVLAFSGGLFYVYRKFKIRLMKNTLILAALCLLAFSASAADSEKILRSKPEKVTVYLQGAQVFRNSTVSIPQGESTIIFDGLEKNIDPQSIQASGLGNYVITETQYLLHYPELQKLKANGNVKYAKTLKMLDDSLILLSYDTENIANQREVLKTEKGVLLNYGLYKGVSKKDSIAFLKDGLSFLREKLNNINNELLRLKKEEAKLTIRVCSIESRKAQIEGEQVNKDLTSQQVTKPDYRIIVTIVSDAATTATIGINYFLPDAGWAPTYDLRTESMEKPIQLTYKATVFQNTGNDWKDVRLTLSTANPNQNFNVPVLNPYFVDVYKNHINKKAGRSDRSSSFNNTTTLSAPTFNDNIQTNQANQQKNVVITSEEAYDYVVMDENLIQAEFEIRLAYSIPSDNKNHFVSILNKELKTNYVHKTIPKLDMKAYLTARITNYEELNLLPGKANVYFGGTFVGKTFLQTGSTEDTLELSLGQDKNVTVMRNKIKDKSKEKVMENDKIYEVAYEIIVKNGNSKSIDIEVLDQVPLAKSQQVTIQKMELNGAKQNDVTGEIKWRNTIKARENKKNHFSFMVKAPKNMQLVVK